MTNKTKGRDISTMSAAELREAGDPYFVDPNELMMLGIDPEQYRRTIEMGGGALAGYMLDRVTDADIIDRLSTIRDRPMSDSAELNRHAANHHDRCRRCSVANVLCLPDPARAVMETMTMNAMTIAKQAVINVGDGRGFIVSAGDMRYIITAAHCLPYSRFPTPHLANGINELTFPNVLGRIVFKTANGMGRAVRS